jgi:hypothetical protein
MIFTKNYIFRLALLFVSALTIQLGTFVSAQTPGNNSYSFAPNFLNQINQQLTPLPMGPNPGDYDDSPATNSHNMMRNENGNPLFFIVD